MKRWPLLVSFVLFIGLCVSAAYWGTRLFKPAPRAVAPAPQMAKADVNVSAAAGLFGGRMAAVAVASNFQLKGVVVADNPPESVAILSADGKPAQATAVNAEVLPGVTVKEVHPKYVLLSEGGVVKRVDLPDTTKAQMSLSSSAEVPVQMASPAMQAMPPVTQPGMAPPAAAPPEAPPVQVNPNTGMPMLPQSTLPPGSRP